MVPYYKEKNPGLPQWAGGMQAIVVLDQPGNVAFTNLDIISGKVVVRCGKSSDIDSIVAKLEGESRTRLLSPTGPHGETPKPQLEYHKILYRIQCVFPPAEVVQSSKQSPGKTAYTLPPGTHEYPFSFKIPFNNSCWGDRSQNASLKLSTDGLELSKPPPSHVKKTLPPTMSGFPGEAEIRYFVKATISRRAFWKENPRAYTAFNFFPIEPPRPRESNNEIYARQKYAFNSLRSSEGTKTKMRGLFGSKSKSTEGSLPGEAPSVTIDARLPEPPILTCNKNIPLRLVLKKLNASTDALYLQSLQISLIGSTKIRAHDVFRTETNSWIVISKSNMGVLLGTASDVAGTEITLDDSLWRTQHLPNTVAPTFQTCNIERFYQLDVRVGLSCAGQLQNAAKAQSIVLPLRLDTQVYSGIAPPPQLLEAMENSRLKTKNPKPTRPIPNPALDEKLQAESGPPPSPMQANGPTTGAGSAEPPESSLVEQVPQYSDAPPSYEDAVATDLPSVNAPRPDYAPPPPSDDDLFRGDEKRSLFGALNR